METTLNQRTNVQQRRELEQLDSTQLSAYQLGRFNYLLDAILPTNKFYQDKLGDVQRPLQSLGEVSELPFTTKDELIGEGSTSGFASNLSYAPDQYTRFHRTSGTKGQPMVVLDTPQDWQWWLEGWQYVLDAAQLDASDRVVMAFSFGPFIGFWRAFDAVVERGAMVAPTGAMSTLARLELISAIQATTIFCTPSYAIHMAQVGIENKFELGSLAVNKIIVAGEPGGSIDSIRAQIENAWQAKVIDHSGATEVGPWGFGDPAGRGIYVNQAQFFPEFHSIETGQPAGEGELSELILTTLGRTGSPVIRYRTGDLVIPNWADNQPSNFVLLQGGVLGRTDDMMIIRGVNVFPTSVERILREFPEIAEYRLTAYKESSMDQLQIEIEDELEDPQRVKQRLELQLGFRIDVKCVAAGSLPRFEAKGKRFIDNR